MYKVLVKADVNDGDYIEEMNDIDEGDIPLLKKIISLLKTNQWGRHNWETSDYCDCPPSEMYEGILSEDEIEFFNGLVPRGEFGIHTVESITLLEVSKIEELL